MKKSSWISLIVFLAVIPATIFLGLKLPGRWYYAIGTIVIIEAMIPFFAAFERRRPKARELVLIAVFCAIAIVSRAAIPLPHFKPTYAVIIIAGMAFGGQTGFLVGGMTAFVSNFFYGQGAFTPWQMMAYGLCGLIAGVLYQKGWIDRRPITMAVFGFVLTAVVVGPLLDTCSLFLAVSRITLKNALAVYAAGFTVNLLLALCTALTLLLVGKPLLIKLDRVRVKYGME